MEKCARSDCASLWMCGRSELMSTPAENTRLRTCSKNGGAIGSHSAIESRQRKSSKEKADREKRQVLKSSKFIREIKKRNSLVSDWLVQSSVFTKNIQAVNASNTASVASKENSVKSWQQLYKQSDNPPISANASEVSEVLFNLKINKANMPNIKPSEMEAEDSIPLGHSAMSGRSSTARRRAQKAERMRSVKRLHGIQPEEESDEVKLLDDYEWNDHDENSQDAGSQPSRDSHTNATSATGKYRSAESNIGSNEHVSRKEIDNVTPQVGDQEVGNEESNYSSKAMPEHQDDVDESSHNQTSKLNSKNTDKQGEDGEKDEEQPEDIIDRFKRRLDQEDKTVFYDMFELIITKLSTTQMSIQKVRNAQKALESKVEALNNTIDVCTQSVDDIDAEIDEINDVNMKLVQAAVKLESQYEELNKNQKMMNMRTNKGCYILNGISVKKDETAKDAVARFIKTLLEITVEIPVVSAHKMGNASHAPIWFKLEDPDDAARIFKNIAKLKDKENERGRKYNLRDYTNEEEREAKIRQQDIVMENGRLPSSNQLETAYNRGKLFVNGEEYEKKLKEPKIKDILFMSREQESMLDSIEIHEGDSKTENQSTFRVFLKQISKLDEAVDVYHAIAKEHISASHVICGYRIFGSSFHTLQDYVDAKEHGGGRKILEVIKNARIWNVVVVVVRYHNGPNLGPRCFEIIGELVQQAIASYPGALNYGRYFTDQDSLRILNDAAVRPKVAEKPKSSRGRRQRRRSGRGANT